MQCQHYNEFQHFTHVVSNRQFKLYAVLSAIFGRSRQYVRRDILWRWHRAGKLHFAN
jgi:hypothetical protein